MTSTTQDEALAFYQREVAETFERGIITLTDMAETSPTPSARLEGKRDGLIKVWEAQGERIRHAKSLNDLAYIIGFIRLASPTEVDAAEGEKEGEELAIGYLRSFAKYLSED